MTGASWVYSDEKGCGGFAVKDREKCLGIFNLIPDRLRGFLRRCVIFAGTIGSGNFARIEERNRCFTSPCCFRRALFSLWRNLPRQGAQVYIYPYESAPYWIKRLRVSTLFRRHLTHPSLRAFFHPTSAAGNRTSQLFTMCSENRVSASCIRLVISGSSADPQRIRWQRYWRLPTCHSYLSADFSVR